MAKELQIYAPLPHQAESIASPARYKLRRRGRRGAKTREALFCAVMGHGPQVNGVPLWKGILQGAKIVWVAPDYPQARAIWREEILPRFEGVAGITIRKSQGDWVVEVRNGGSLTIVSAENIDSQRGRKYHGAIIDEAAHLDLEYVWTMVIRHTLIDYRGWAIFPSTPNFGKDGNEKRPHGPSYFNILCEREQKPREDPEWLGPEWDQIHSTTHDNPKIPREELEALEKEYKDRRYAYQQEVLALLLSGVEGVFFTEFRKTIHCPPMVTIPAQAWIGAGLDWGYSSPYKPAGWLGLEAQWMGPHRMRRHTFFEYAFHELPPYTAGYNAGKAMLPHPRPEFIAADSSMWDVGDGRGGKWTTSIAEEFQRGLDDACGRTIEGASRAPQLFPAPKGKQSREVRALAARQGLALHAKVRADGTLPPWGEPEWTIDAQRCPHLVRCLEVLPVDPHNPELPATEKVFDHPYDGETYLAVSRRPELPKPEPVREANRSYDAEKFKGVKVRMQEEEGTPSRRFRGRAREYADVD